MIRVVLDHIKYKEKLLKPFLHLVFIILLYSSCNSASTSKFDKNEKALLADTIEEYRNNKLKLSKFEQLLIENGLVDVKSVDPSIVIDLKYASTDNIAGKKLYHDMPRAYVQADVALMLKQANMYVSAQLPYHSLIIFDAVRPHTVQRMLWDSVSLPKSQKIRFLAHPDKLSLHNYGVAVDVSIVDSSGTLLDMGTPFDSPEELAYPCLEKYFIEKGLILKSHLSNRLVLRDAMIKAGFINNKYEWWHFSACNRKTAHKQYALIKDFNSIIAPDTAHTEMLADVWFKVQIYMSDKLLKPSHAVYKAPKVSYYNQNNYYKYTSGAFRELQECYDYRDSLRQVGFTQAFVVCFNGNKRIHIQEALFLTAENE